MNTVNIIKITIVLLIPFVSFGLQKYPEFEFPSKQYSSYFKNEIEEYYWAFTSEKTDIDTIDKQFEILKGIGSSNKDRKLATYIINRDDIKKALRLKYKLGAINYAIKTKNEFAELESWLYLLNLSFPGNDMKDVLKYTCGKRNEKEMLQYFRLHFGKYIQSIPSFITDYFPENADRNGLDFKYDQKMEFLYNLHKSADEVFNKLSEKERFWCSLFYLDGQGQKLAICYTLQQEDKHKKILEKLKTEYRENDQTKIDFIIKSFTVSN